MKKISDILNYNIEIPFPQRIVKVINSDNKNL